MSSSSQATPSATMSLPWRTRTSPPSRVRISHAHACAARAVLRVLRESQQPLPTFVSTTKRPTACSSRRPWRRDRDDLLDAALIATTSWLGTFSKVGSAPTYAIVSPSSDRHRADFARGTHARCRGRPPCRATRDRDQRQQVRTLRSTHSGGQVHLAALNLQRRILGQRRRLQPQRLRERA